MKYVACALLLASLAVPLVSRGEGLAAPASASSASEASPIVASPFSTETSPKAVEAAKKRGAASAARDIEAGVFRILSYGKQPAPTTQPRLDAATGYRIQPVAGCIVSEPFCAEVQAYNQTMREWHEKNVPR